MGCGQLAVEGLASGNGAIPVAVAYAHTGVCDFPGCAKPTPLRAPCRGDDCLSLCLEHDAHLFYDPAEFHRLWELREHTA